MKPSYETLERENSQLKNLLKKALDRINELEKKLGKNSKNSSKSPSTDQKANTQNISHQKRKAHPGKARNLYPQERIDHQIDCALEMCPFCESKKLQQLKDPPFVWQQAELPSQQAIVTQFNCLKYRCKDCGQRSVGRLPEGVPFSAFGPKLMAFIATLTGRFHLAKRETMILLKELYGVELATGSVTNVEENVSRALNGIYEKIHRCAVFGSLTRHFDETSWRDRGKRHYAWIATTEIAAYYRMDPNRSQEAFFRLIGEARDSPAVTDRYSAYNAIEGPHQYCFAHLIRDFHAFAEAKGEDGKIGARIEQELRRACKIHAQWREGQFTERQRKAKLYGSKRRLENCFIDAMAFGSDELACLSERLSDNSEHLWAFLTTPGMEPTNNMAERDLRKLVLWRKKSYGTRSCRGEKFVERITSVVETLKKHSREIFSFIEEAVRAFYRGETPPNICAEWGI